MSHSDLLKSFGIWTSFIPLAILNGLLREKCLAPIIGQRLALPLSGLTGASLFFCFTYLTLPWLGQLKLNQYRLIGLAWLVMTVLFEFLFGRFVARKSWAELLQAYDILSGNLWMLVLLVIAVSPFLVAKLRKLIS